MEPDPTSMVDVAPAVIVPAWRKPTPGPAHHRPRRAGQYRALHPSLGLDNAKVPLTTHAAWSEESARVAPQLLRNARPIYPAANTRLGPRPIRTHVRQTAAPSHPTVGPRNER